MAKQYLTFTLEDTLFAVNVFQVREVLAYEKPQILPNPDPVIAGLIRSRGQSISVVDLRRKFGMPDGAVSADTRIIVLELIDPETGEQGIFGAIADSVAEVLELEDSSCEAAPELGNSIAAEYILGIGQQNGNFIILLDVNHIFSFAEISVTENEDVSEKNMEKIQGDSEISADGENTVAEIKGSGKGTTRRKKND